MKKAESLESPHEGSQEQKSPLLSVCMSKVSVPRISSIFLWNKVVL